MSPSLTTNPRPPSPYVAYFYLFPNGSRKLALSNSSFNDSELYKLEVECSLVESIISCLDIKTLEMLVKYHFHFHAGSGTDVINFLDFLDSVKPFFESKNEFKKFVVIDLPPI
jgi:hypothetical protein